MQNYPQAHSHFIVDMAHATIPAMNDASPEPESNPDSDVALAIPFADWIGMGAALDNAADGNEPLEIAAGRKVGTSRLEVEYLVTVSRGGTGYKDAAAFTIEIRARTGGRATRMEVKFGKIIRSYSA